ncbi:MAG: tRNA uracil 4-sulfurtransferase ThiI [Coriobacteriia bacterium]
MFERALLVHYHEIGLKGRNRAVFERRLLENIRFALEDLPLPEPIRIASRVLVPAGDAGGSERAQALERVARQPGVTSVGDAYVTSRDVGEIGRAALIALGEAADGSFKVEARRSATAQGLSGTEMNVEVGAYLVEKTGRRVDLSRPDAIVRVEVVQGEAYVFSRRVEGVGGLPTGVSGHVVALLSAGIDSPVAAWRAIKRGAVVTALHLSGEPHTDGHSARIAGDLCERLGLYGGLAALQVVRFGDLQKEISLFAPPDLRVLLYRRLMLRIAEEVAREVGALALVTGESLGQVASQTLENIAAVDAAATIAVLRPLIGMDKNEIITRARTIGTYDMSIEPHTDCCTLFMPRRPATHATIAELDEAERGLDVSRMVADAMGSRTTRTYRCAAMRGSAR